MCVCVCVCVLYINYINAKAATPKLNKKNDEMPSLPSLKQ